MLIITGTIFEFKIPVALGFGYCKIFDFRHLRAFDGTLVKVYDYIVESPITDFNVLRTKEWLFGARRMAAPPNMRGKGAWKYKGVLLSDEDSFIPDFKWSNKSAPWIENESEIKEWYVIRNLTEVDYSHSCPFDSVKHLENTVVSSQIGITIRTAMETLRIQKKNVSQYFDLSDTTNLGIYNMMNNVPIYQSIPKEIRGKALC